MGLKTKSQSLRTLTVGIRNSHPLELRFFKRFSQLVTRRMTSKNLNFWAKQNCPLLPLWVGYNLKIPIHILLFLRFPLIPCMSFLFQPHLVIISSPCLFLFISANFLRDPAMRHIKLFL